MKKINTSFAQQSFYRTPASFLRQYLNSGQTQFIMEAHNALSAKIVQESGFIGIWASGLSIATSLGLRDANEASWTQVLEILEYMSDAVNIPILVDGDTGYGNFNNVRRLTKKLCDRKIAGVCLEDKLFPKQNSFVGENQPLANIDEFCGKIAAAKDTQTDPDFCVVARVEALISGYGMAEALHRAEAYRRAGGDAILIHSKKSTADEILTFATEWAQRSPLVIVPTKYYATPTDLYYQAKIALVIWANHNLRASIAAMRDVCENIYKNKTIQHVEKQVASLDDVFGLVDNHELELAEKKYLPSKAVETTTYEENVC